MECSGGETSLLLEGTFALPGPSLEDSGLSVVTIRVKQRHKTRSIHQVRGTLECGDGSEKKKKWGRKSLAEAIDSNPDSTNNACQCSYFYPVLEESLSSPKSSPNIVFCLLLQPRKYCFSFPKLLGLNLDVSHSHIYYYRTSSSVLIGIVIKF